jgi:hypothetical protein
MTASSLQLSRSSKDSARQRLRHIVVGKNHNTPGFQVSHGPFNQWPTGGFEYFYGFRRRHEPVAAEPVPQHDAIYPFQGAVL